jgi:hypothetical protein
MQRLILFIVLLLSISVDMTAQTQRFKAGIIAGTNFAQIDGDNSGGYLKFGFTGGLRGVVIINDKIDISIELLFDQRGSRSQKVFDNAGFFPFKITNNYASIPVIFNIQDWLDESEEFYKLHFHGGFSYGRLLNAEVDDEDPVSSLSQVALDFRQNDISFLVGATYYVNKNLAFTGRFTRSITPLYKNGDGPINVGIPFIQKHLTFQTLYMF